RRRHTRFSRDWSSDVCSSDLFAEWDAQLHTNKERYNVIAADLQMIARRMLISGMHVHVGIEDDDLRIDIMNQATYFLPHLLALRSEERRVGKEGRAGRTAR